MLSSLGDYLKAEKKSKKIFHVLTIFAIMLMTLGNDKYTWNKIENSCCSLSLSILSTNFDRKISKLEEKKP